MQWSYVQCCFKPGRRWQIKETGKKAGSKQDDSGGLSFQIRQTVASKVLKHDLQRLRDAPVENEDAFQHIDDDMLAQVIYQCNGKNKRKLI